MLLDFPFLAYKTTNKTVGGLKIKDYIKQNQMMKIWFT